MRNNRILCFLLMVVGGWGGVAVGSKQVANSWKNFFVDNVEQDKLINAIVTPDVVEYKNWALALKEGNDKLVDTTLTQVFKSPALLQSPNTHAMIRAIRDVKGLEFINKYFNIALKNFAGSITILMSKNEAIGLDILTKRFKNVLEAPLNGDSSEALNLYKEKEKSDQQLEIIEKGLSTENVKNFVNKNFCKTMIDAAQDGQNIYTSFLASGGSFFELNRLTWRELQIVAGGHWDQEMGFGANKNTYKVYGNGLNGKSVLHYFAQRGGPKFIWDDIFKGKKPVFADIMDGWPHGSEADKWNFIEDDADKPNNGCYEKYSKDILEKKIDAEFLGKTPLCWAVEGYDFRWVKEEGAIYIISQLLKWGAWISLLDRRYYKTSDSDLFDPLDYRYNKKKSKFIKNTVQDCLQSLISIAGGINGRFIAGRTLLDWAITNNDFFGVEYLIKKAKNALFAYELGGKKHEQYPKAITKGEWEQNNKIFSYIKEENLDKFIWLAYMNPSSQEQYSAEAFSKKCKEIKGFVDGTNFGNMTPLQWACWFQDDKAAEYFLKRGANVDFQNKETENLWESFSPLGFALCPGFANSNVKDSMQSINLNLIKVLLTHRANIALLGDGNIQKLHELIKNNKELFGEVSLIHWAVRAGNFEEKDTIFYYDRNTNKNHWQFKGSLNLITRLFESNGLKKLKISVDANDSTNLRWMPLFYAVFSNDTIDIAKYLIETQKAHVNYVDAPCNTPLYYAIKRERLDFIKLLFENGALLHSLRDDDLTYLVNLIKNKENIKKEEEDDEDAMFTLSDLYHYAIKNYYEDGKEEIEKRSNIDKKKVHQGIRRLSTIGLDFKDITEKDFNSLLQIFWVAHSIVKCII